MNRRQQRRKHRRRIEHPHSVQRARTERRYLAEQAGLSCVKAHPDWAPERAVGKAGFSTTCECGRKLRNVKAKARAVSA